MLSIFLCQPGAPDNLHLMNLENIKRQGRDERSLAQTFFRIFSRQTDDDVAARKDSPGMSTLYGTTATGKIMSALMRFKVSSLALSMPYSTSTKVRRFSSSR